MRNWTRWLVPVAGLLCFGLGAPATAHAGTDVDDVVSALGLTAEPADYVLLVDTSGSMQADGRYTSVRNQLATLVKGLSPKDRVSLLTFDTTVTPRFRGEVGKDGGAVLAELPAKAAGEHTDIGAAISAGLTELERSDTRRLAALILITDGKLDAPGSKYADVKSSAWKELKTRAGALGTDHQVAAYAVSLMASTDAGLLKKVLPQATEVDAADVGDRFAAVGSDLVRLQAAQALKSELAQPIVVNWHGDLGAALAEGTPAAVQLEFVSPYPHVPVQLSKLAVQTAPGLHVTLTGLPDKVTLDPNGHADVSATATVSGSGGPDATVGLTAVVTSSWSDALTGDLGLEFAPAIQGTATVPAAPIKVPPTLLPTVAGVAGGLAVAFVLFLFVRALFTPSLSGLLTIRRNGRDLADIVLEGRRMKLTAPEAVPDLAGLTGAVAGSRGGGKGQRAVRVNLRFGATSARGVVRDGSSVALGDLDVEYTSGRRRILDKIGLPRPGTGASVEAGAGATAAAVLSPVSP
ncbi:MAG: VWA domain-containing protein [Propionicimonas sp.]|uniref:vWA domain-containing protein n=1 Tax=Propionicimonas sp. TaxID=1955623 RepID=UPI003D115144